MATVPCFRHGSVQRGRVSTFYPAFIKDGVRDSKKLPICMPCTRELAAAHASDWLDQAFNDSPVQDPSCTRCGQLAQTLSDLTRFFCTVYVDGKTRRDYMAYYCDACVSDARQEFSLAR